MKFYVPILAIFSLLLFNACDKDDANTDPVVVPPAIQETYTTLKSVIDQNCVGCHSYGGNAAAFGDLSNYPSIKTILDNSSQEFINRITSTEADYKMPPNNNLSSSQIEKLVDWVNNDYPEN